MTLPTLIDAARRSPGPVPLRCPCGGRVELVGVSKGEDGRLEPLPIYTCQRCSKTGLHLRWLAAEAGRARR